MTKQERAARTRHTLIRSAAEVFDQDGFAPSSLTSISRRAGVSNGALHFHFVNKGALAEEVEVEAMAILRGIAGPWRSAAEADSSLQTLVDTSHTLVARLQEDTILRAGFGLSADITWKSRWDLRQYWVDWVGEGLSVAARQGALAEGVRPEDARTVIAAATVGLGALGRADPRWWDRRVCTRLWRLVLPRLAADHLAGRLRAEGGDAPPEREAPGTPAPDPV
ncbi:ScbR family autoregulator-binding transcription factor [Streptomyces sp. NPDC052309]|uniref:ScbR family autoregulator-binding transcription factor n=1 Tax=Streptomyces sp. NPDC052309 TaxID=3155421 RepID=UPI0034190F93